MGNGGLTLNVYATAWLARAGARLRPATIRGYRSVLTNHVFPVLGETRLRELTRQAIRALLVTLLAHGLSAGTVRMVYATISAVLSGAEDDELIAHNPARGAARKLWKRRPDEDGKAPSREQFEALVALSARRYPLLTPYWITLAHTGLRPGEGLALSAHEVDIASSRLAVVRTYHGAGRFGPTKSGRPRLVPLNRDAREALAGQIASARAPHRWLFANEESGFPWSPCHPQAAFRALREELGFRRPFTPHSLRHATATWLIERGAKEVHVQRLLGHHSIQLTIDLYARGADLPPIVDLLEDGHARRQAAARASLPPRSRGRRTAR